MYCQFESGCSRLATFSVFDSDGNHVGRVCKLHLTNVLMAHFDLQAREGEGAREALQVTPFVATGAAWAE